MAITVETMRFSRGSARDTEIEDSLLMIFITLFLARKREKIEPMTLVSEIQMGFNVIR